jgi:hypothetical protein
LLVWQDRELVMVRMLHRMFVRLAGWMGPLAHSLASKVQEAIGELDLAIRDVRNILFDHRQPDSPSGGQPG